MFGVHRIALCLLRQHQESSDDTIYVFFDIDLSKQGQLYHISTERYVIRTNACISIQIGHPTR